MENELKSLRFFRMRKNPPESFMHSNSIENKGQIIGGLSKCESSVTPFEVAMAAATTESESEEADKIQENELNQVVDKFKTEKLYDQLEQWKGEKLEDKARLLIETWIYLKEECLFLPTVVDIFNKLFWKTIQTILSDEWQALSHAQKRQMASALSHCSQKLGSLIARAPRLCSTLIMAVYDPWDEPILKKVIEGKDGLNDPNIEKFLASEPLELVLARVESLSRADNDEAALRLCQYYMKAASVLGTLDETQLCYEQEQDANAIAELKRQNLLPFVEWTVRLLHKKERLKDIVKETANCSCHEGVQLIRRIRESGSDSYLELAEILTYIFLVRDLLFPSMYCCTRELMMMWASLQVLQKRTLREICFAAKKLIVLHASTSAHFYLFVDILWDEFGSLLFPLYLEMYVRGLTADLNHLEVARQELSTATIFEMEAHVAYVYTKLGSLFHLQSLEVFARECILSAFSVEPTYERMHLLGVLTKAAAVGKSMGDVMKTGRSVSKGAADDKMEKEMETVMSDILNAVSESQCENAMEERQDTKVIESTEISVAEERLQEENMPQGIEMKVSSNSPNEVERQARDVVECNGRKQNEFTNIEESVEEMISFVVDNFSLPKASDPKQFDDHLSLDVSTSRKSVNVVQCNCGKRCTTPSDDETDSIRVRKVVLPTRRMDFFHPILDSKICGVHTDLLKDLVIVLESTRHNLLRSCEDWDFMRPQCEEYLETMSAMKILLQHSSLYDSVDTESDSLSEDEDFFNHFATNEDCALPSSVILEDSDEESVYSKAKRRKSKTPERHPNRDGCATTSKPKSKLHRHANDLETKRKRRKKRRRARKEREQELTVRRVLFDGLDDGRKTRKKRKRPTYKKGKEKMFTHSIDINTVDIASIVNPNARILLSRLEDSAGHNLGAHLFSRFEEKSVESLQPIEEIQSHLQSSNLLNGPNECPLVGEPPLQMMQTVPSSSRQLVATTAVTQKSGEKSKLKAKHHRLLKLKKNSKKHRRLKFEKKLKNFVKRKARKCVNTSSQTDPMRNDYFSPIPHTLLQNSGIGSRSLIDEFGKPVLAEQPVPNASLPAPPTDGSASVLTNFAPSVCTNTPPLQTKAPSNRMKKTVPVVQVVMPSFGKEKAKQSTMLNTTKTDSFCAGLPHSRMSVIAPWRNNAVVALRVQQNKSIKACEVNNALDKPASVISSGANVEHPATIVSGAVNASPQLITFKTISSTSPLLNSGLNLQQMIMPVSNTIQQPCQAIQNVQGLTIPLTAGINTQNGKLVTHKILIPIHKLNDSSLKLMSLASSNPNVFIMRPQQQQAMNATNIQQEIPSTAKNKNKKRIWRADREKPLPVYEWRKIGPKKSATGSLQMQKIISKGSPSSNGTNEPVLEQTLVDGSVRPVQIGPSAGSTNGSMSFVAQVSVPVHENSSAKTLQQNGFRSGEVVKRRVSTSDLTSLDSGDRAMSQPLRPISEPLDLNGLGPSDEAILNISQKQLPSSLNSDSKDLGTLDSSISDAVRFSLMFSDDGTGGIENQVGISNYNTYQDDYLQPDTTTGSYAEPMTEDEPSEFEPQNSGFSTPLTSTVSFVAGSPTTPNNSSGWKPTNETKSLVQLQAARKKEIPNSKSTREAMMKIIEEIKKKEKSPDKSPSPGKRSKTSPSNSRCQCETCGRGFVSTYNLRRHYKNVHKMEIASPKSSHSEMTNLSMSSPEVPFSPGGGSDTPVSPPCRSNLEPPNFCPKILPKTYRRNLPQAPSKKVQCNWQSDVYQRSFSYSGGQKSVAQPLVKDPLSVVPVVEPRNGQNNAALPFAKKSQANIAPKMTPVATSNVSTTTGNQNEGFEGIVAGDQWGLGQGGQLTDIGLVGTADELDNITPFSFEDNCQDDANLLLQISNQPRGNALTAVENSDCVCDVDEQKAVTNTFSVLNCSPNGRTVEGSSKVQVGLCEPKDEFEEINELVSADGIQNRDDFSMYIKTQAAPGHLQPKIEVREIKNGVSVPISNENIEFAPCHSQPKVKVQDSENVKVQVNDSEPKFEIRVTENYISVGDSFAAYEKTHSAVGRFGPKVEISEFENYVTHGAGCVQGGESSTTFGKTDVAVNRSEPKIEVVEEVMNLISIPDSSQNVEMPIKMQVAVDQFEPKSEVREAEDNVFLVDCTGNHDTCKPKVESSREPEFCIPVVDCSRTVGNAGSCCKQEVAIDHESKANVKETKIFYSNENCTIQNNVNSALLNVFEQKHDPDEFKHNPIPNSEQNSVSADNNVDGCISDTKVSLVDCKSIGPFPSMSPDSNLPVQSCRVNSVNCQTPGEPANKKPIAEITLESEDESVPDSRSDDAKPYEGDDSPSKDSGPPSVPEVPRGRTRSREGKKHPKRFCPCCENDSPSTAKKCRTGTSCGKSSKGGSRKSAKSSRAKIHTRSSQKPRTRSTP